MKKLCPYCEKKPLCRSNVFPAQTCGEKECQKKRVRYVSKRWRKENPEHYRKNLLKNLKRKHEMTIERRKNRPDPLCFICGEKKSLKLFMNKKTCGNSECERLYRNFMNRKCYLKKTEKKTDEAV